MLNTMLLAVQKTQINLFYVKDWEWSYVICTIFFPGRIVFMSSIIAYFSLGNGIYSMTKAAIEKFCDALRLEMKKFGVRVSDVTSSCCMKLPAISNIDLHMRKREVSLLKCSFLWGKKKVTCTMNTRQQCGGGSFGQGKTNKCIQNNIYSCAK